MITIYRNGVEYELNVDIPEELSYYDWHRARPKENELVACSPFRDETSPSFSINLETGLWIDFGSTHDLYSKGGLVTLLSFLRNETPTEVEDYLLDKYGIDLSDVNKLKLNVNFNIDTKVDTIISIEDYQQYAYRSPYLAGRGISEKVQRAFKVGFDRKSKAVAFAWTDIKGNIVNIKFRSTKSKQFYYYPTGQQLRNHIYGMHFIYKLKPETVFLVESEIDCLYMWTHGFPAIALGGSKISDKRKQLLLRCPSSRIVLATDNDSVGMEIREKVKKLLIGYKDLYEIQIPNNYKDVNDIPPEILKEVCNKAIPVNLKLF
ncbi:toprim domain-containing protein [Bacillus cereus group sp. Bc015]|uniref:toprim domain-containing protein n=1 Tax=Bacillus cereus group sp. Bc015 TaxID=3018123 RepID=UPI0022E314D8|nr:toprim domain-containing protein [Bacillus cereus group sp. Bc015]MDA2738439.1 toprim domain-containing protein [Bacillus cereus group sp. Bc015]